MSEYEMRNRIFQINCRTKSVTTTEIKVLEGEQFSVWGTFLIEG